MSVCFVWYTASLMSFYMTMSQSQALSGSSLLSKLSQGSRISRGSGVCGESEIIKSSDILCDEDINTAKPTDSRLLFTEESKDPKMNTKVCGRTINVLPVIAELPQMPEATEKPYPLVPPNSPNISPAPIPYKHAAFLSGYFFDKDVISHPKYRYRDREAMNVNGRTPI